LLEFEDSGSFDIGFGADTYAPADTSATSVGTSPSNAQIENTITPQTGYVRSDFAFNPKAQQSAQGPVTTSDVEDAAGFNASGAGVPQGQLITDGPLAGQTVYAPSQLSPMDLNRISVGQTPEQQFKPTGTLPTPEKSFFDKMSTQDMVRLGLAGGLGIYGATQAKKGAQQAQQAAAEQKAVGAPYQAKGKELIRAAETGELTPTSQQQLQALQARLAQGAESRGGVGAAQVAAQTEAYRQQLLSQQYNLGLQVSNIGDQIALGAIRTGLQADQALNQASTNFYTNLAAIGAGIPITQTRTA
jgi:HPt (histidine-containing phosphotransfer) domain-containing protein